jgi:hypothetical protein
MRTPEERHARRLNTCKRFNGIMNARCQAGVLYADVRLSKGTGLGYALPCFNDDGCVECEHRELRTPEDLQREEEESAASWARVRIARAAIVEATEGKRGVSGRIACPNCVSAGLKGVLSFSVARSNGHIHGTCSTKGCACWME